MIKTLKQTISNMFYWIKKKLIQFKKWLIVLIFGATILAAPLVPPQLPDIALEKIQAKYEASELKDNYRLEKTAFILDAVDENAIQAEIGNKNSDSFEPSLTLRKWSDEVNFKVKYKHGEKEKDQKVDIENKKIKWKGKKTEVHYYEMKKGDVLLGEELESDVFEVEVLLLEKPDTNIVGFDIETQGLSFYYQPELTQEEIDEGAFRPENVIGSYAVYHESKAGDYSKMAGKNYMAGKAFHIYRPKIIDSAGKEVWGKLNIADNLLTVEIPQDFLDNAVYPVRHAAGLTFGYTNVGSSTEGSWRNYVTAHGDTYTGVAGSGVSMSVYVENTSGDASIQMALYDNASPSNYITNGKTDSVTFNTPNWYTANFVSAPTLEGIEYYLVQNNNSPTATDKLYYDNAGTNNVLYAAQTFNVWPATITWTVAGVKHKYSIYCTYTAEVSATLTGTAIPTITKSDIVIGGKTIVITLTGDTWVATVGADNAITTALIAGIDSAQSEGTGWDAVVKANMTYSDITRTSNTIVTIILSAEATYDITATETITVTIPATAVTAAAQITASPTFTVTVAAAARRMFLIE